MSLNVLRVEHNKGSHKTNNIINICYHIVITTCTAYGQLIHYMPTLKKLLIPPTRNSNMQLMKLLQGLPDQTNNNLNKDLLVNC